MNDRQVRAAPGAFEGAPGIAAHLMPRIIDIAAMGSSCARKVPCAAQQVPMRANTSYQYQMSLQARMSLKSSSKPEDRWKA
jgi:hypothetical protein